MKKYLILLTFIIFYGCTDKDEICTCEYETHDAHGNTFFQQVDYPCEVSPSPCE